MKKPKRRKTPSQLDREYFMGGWRFLAYLHWFKEVLDYIFRRYDKKD